MSIYQEVGLKAFTLVAATACPQTIGIWSGATGGSIAVEMWDQPGTTTTFAGVPAGVWLPISIRKFVSGPADCLGISV